jgi:hypothetical protein
MRNADCGLRNERTKTSECGIENQKRRIGETEQTVKTESENQTPGEAEKDLFLLFADSPVRSFSFNNQQSTIINPGGDHQSTIINPGANQQ